MERAPTFFEIGEYIAWCEAEPRKDGQWSGMICFERRADYGKALVSMQKHTIVTPFATAQEATTAACQQAQRLVENNGTGF